MDEENKSEEIAQQTEPAMADKKNDDWTPVKEFFKERFGIEIEGVLGTHIHDGKSAYFMLGKMGPSTLLSIMLSSQTE